MAVRLTVYDLIAKVAYLLARLFPNIPSTSVASSCNAAARRGRKDLDIPNCEYYKTLLLL